MVCPFCGILYSNLGDYRLSIYIDWKDGHDILINEKTFGEYYVEH